MHNKFPAQTHLSYSSALSLWHANQDRIKADRLKTESKPPVSSQVSKFRRLLARAKDWAARVYGTSHNQASDQEDVDSPLPDHTRLHPSAQAEDIKDHIHKAIKLIDWDTHPCKVLQDHPVIQREYILLLLRFKSSSLPSKSDFVIYVQSYLNHLNLETQQLDELLFTNKETKHQQHGWR
jgi:hypothetical protein